MPDVIGIENLKALVKVGLTFGQKVAADLKDKKISWLEAIGLVPDIFSAIGAVKTWATVQQEIRDLSAAETLELETYVMSEFNIPNTKVKAFIDHALMQVISINNLVNEFKHIKDPVV
jgi:hypothetical protein